MAILQEQAIWVPEYAAWQDVALQISLPEASLLSLFIIYGDLDYMDMCDIDASSRKVK